MAILSRRRGPGEGGRGRGKGKGKGRRSYVSLGLAAVAFGYVALDYWRERASWLPHSLSSSVQPVLWGALTCLCLLRAPSYPFWHIEIRAVPKFLACFAFMGLAFAMEIVMVQFATVVLGLDWHREHEPLPDTGQWILLASNEILPRWLVSLLRMRLIELHHYIMLFFILGFSAVFGAVKPPGMGLAARYCLSMGVSRILRFLTFASTILPAVRPWCADGRFSATTVAHPHPWAQKYYVPYAKDQHMFRALLDHDRCIAKPPPFPEEYIPSWGALQFLAPLLRPKAPQGPGPEKASFTIRPGGGCNDLAYSGHVVVAVLTACAWQEAHPGWASALIWLLVLHSSQREIREHQHYSVDVVVALYVGLLLWHATAWVWSRGPRGRGGGGGGGTKEERTAAALAPRMSELVKAAKDWDMERVRSAVLSAAAAAGEGGGRGGEGEGVLGGEGDGEGEGEWWQVEAAAGRKVGTEVYFGFGILVVVVLICLMAIVLNVGG